MADTLPSLQLRWHNGRGAVAVAAPLTCVPVAPQLPPIDVLPGMGLDILDLVRAGMDLVNNPLGALADLVRAGLGEAALAGMRAIGWGWLDTFADIVDDFGLLIKAGWELLEQIPVLGGWLAMMEQMGDNFLDTLAYELFGQRSNPADAPRGNIRCWRQLPATDPNTTGALDYQQFKSLPGGTEIARQIRGLIAPMLPEIWRFADDAPPVEFSTLERHADPPALYGQSGSMNWDIDDDYAGDVASHTPGSPYLKVWKLNNRRILAEIGAIRLVSFWPCSRPDGRLEFEHEGDGERVYVHFQVDPTNSAGQLDLGAKEASIRLTGVIGWGHGHPYPFGWDRLNRSDNGRVRVATSRGSHAVTVLEGVARSGGGVLEWFNSDCYPGPNVAGSVASAGCRVATSPDEVLNVYFGRQYFGHARSATMRWGDRRAGAADPGYELYKDGCDAFGREDLDLATAFPLLALPRLGGTGTGACGCGTGHVCAPPASASGDEAAEDALEPPIVTDDVPTLWDTQPPCILIAPEAPCPVTLYLRRTSSQFGLAADFLRWRGEARRTPTYEART